MVDLGKGHNYKPITRTITIAGIKIPVPQNAAIIFLWDNVQLSSGADTFNDSSFTSYQVPTNHKLTVVGLILKHTGAGTFVLWMGISANALTVQLAQFKTGGDTGTDEVFISENNVTIAAGQYLTHKPEVTDDPPLEVTIKKDAEKPEPDFDYDDYLPTSEEIITTEQEIEKLALAKKVSTK